MKQIVIACVVLVAAVTVFYVLHASDEQQLKKNLSLMAEYCSTDVQEPVVLFAKKVSAAAKMCTDPVEVVIDSFTIDRSFSIQELRDHIMMMKRRLVGTAFNFEDRAVHLISDDSAVITTTLRLNGRNIEGRFTDAYEVQIGAQKKEGEWLFSSFQVVEFMER